ncbi:hypothetical protein NDU88_005277 [Pleurodeles waltl]|uniref:Uncharacterized protein n=1 Tax=Pleurodeles waltl TaxID=8319 RepID=A0AAV7TWP0_PLEWA|nr:hypothetical protein NDU88_005277 [Pleurodeles waltl]
MSGKWFEATRLLGCGVNGEPGVLGHCCRVGSPGSEPDCRYLRDYLTFGTRSGAKTCPSRKEETYGSTDQHWLPAIFDLPQELSPC